MHRNLLERAGSHGPAEHDVQQKVDTRAAYLDARGVNGSEVGPDKHRHGDVVEPGDADLIRHADAALPQPIDDSDCHEIVECDDGRRAAGDGQVPSLDTPSEVRREVAPVSYTHLTLPTNREV